MNNCITINMINCITNRITKCIPNCCIPMTNCIPNCDSEYMDDSDQVLYKDRDSLYKTHNIRTVNKTQQNPKYLSRVLIASKHMSFIRLLSIFELDQSIIALRRCLIAATELTLFDHSSLLSLLSHSHCS